MEIEEYIKMQSSPQSSRRECKTVEMAAPETHSMSQASVRCNSESDISRMNQDTPYTFDMPRSGHSVENIYEHIR